MSRSKFKEGCLDSELKMTWEFNFHPYCSSILIIPTSHELMVTISLNKSIQENNGTRTRGRTRNDDCVETGHTAQIDFTVVRYSIANCGLPRNDLFRFQDKSESIV
jgi:hypothetical protein